MTPAQMPDEIASIQGGGIPDEDADVIFIDYDGTVLHSYSAAELLALESLPDNPAHSGLTAQGWNYTLAQAKATVQDTGRAVIGQMYTTSDGATRLYIRLACAMTLYVTFSSTDTVTIDWGDGTTQDVPGMSGENRTGHAYEQAGEYCISLEGGGVITFPSSGTANESYGFVLLRRTDAGGSPSYKDRGAHSALRRVELGSNVTTLPSGCFGVAYNLETITIPQGTALASTYTFAYCKGLKALVLPLGMTSLPGYTARDCAGLRYVSIAGDAPALSGHYHFYECRALRRIGLPYGLNYVSQYCFYNCAALREVIVPSSATYIGGHAFEYAGLERIDTGCARLDTSCFNECRALASADISGLPANGLSSTYNFMRCRSLTTLTIPAAVTSISSGLLSSCEAMEEVHVQAETPPTLSSADTFSSFTGPIYVPYSADHSVLEAYKAETNWVTYTDRLTEEAAS